MVDLVSPELGADADSAKNMSNARLLGDYLRRGIVSDESRIELMKMIVHGQGEVARRLSSAERRHPFTPRHVTP